jgi:hypothetical protein
MERQTMGTIVRDGIVVGVSSGAGGLVMIGIGASLALTGRRN